LKFDNTFSSKPSSIFNLDRIYKIHVFIDLKHHGLKKIKSIRKETGRVEEGNNSITFNPKFQECFGYLFILK